MTDQRSKEQPTPQKKMQKAQTKLPEMVTVPFSTMDKVLGYLAKKPWAEVTELMSSLQNAIAVSVVNQNAKDKPEAPAKAKKK